MRTHFPPYPVPFGSMQIWFTQCLPWNYKGFRGQLPVFGFFFVTFSSSNKHKAKKKIWFNLLTLKANNVRKIWNDKWCRSFRKMYNHSNLYMKPMDWRFIISVCGADHPSQFCANSNCWVVAGASHHGTITVLGERRNKIIIIPIQNRATSFGNTIQFNSVRSFQWNLKFLCNPTPSLNNSHVPPARA